MDLESSPSVSGQFLQMKDVPELTNMLMNFILGLSPWAAKCFATIGHILDKAQDVIYIKE